MALTDISRWEKRVALVTGASAGIGAAICKTLVKNGMTVIGCARRIERLDQLAEECRLLDYEGKMVPHKCDLTKEDEIEAMFAWIKSNHGGVDVCVNNAGLATDTSLIDCDSKQMREMIDINIIALVLCSKLAVKSMLQRKVNDGHIFMINSMAGHRLTGRFNFYASTKFAVTALTEGFRRELVENTRIRVTGISPGVVETEFLNRSLGEVKSKELYKTMAKMSAQDIADALIYALSTPENIQVHDIQLRPTGTKL